MHLIRTQAPPPAMLQGPVEGSGMGGEGVMMLSDQSTVIRREKRRQGRFLRDGCVIALR